MRVFVSLLRGINLGGHHKIRMGELGTMYESLGFQSVTSFLQSGNVVFRSDARDMDRLAKDIEDAIEARFEFRPRVILRTPAELRQVVERNPYRAMTNMDGSKLAVLFLDRDPGDGVREQIRQIRAAPEEVRVEGRELYIYFPNGMGRSKLPKKLSAVLTADSTARNWNTVTKLSDIANMIEKQET